MISPACNVNGSSTLDGFVEVPASATSSIALANAAGANTWTLECISTDDNQTTDAINATLIINSTAKTATFLAPVTGSMIFESVVNSGYDINGRPNAGLRSRFKVCVPYLGRYFACVDETTEHSTVFGWTPLLNDLVRNGTQGGAGGASLSASYVTLSTDPGLLAERVLTAGTGLSLSDGGAGTTVTLAVRDGIVATISGSKFTGPVTGTLGLNAAAPSLFSSTPITTGRDAFFFVSGSTGRAVGNAERRVSVFQGDVVASGTISGSIHQTAGGLSYLVAVGGIAITSQSNGQILISGSGAGGGGGGAPSTAQYLTLATDGTLSQERVLTMGTGLRGTDGGAGSTYTLAVNNNVVATISGSTFSGNISAPLFTGAMSGSHTKLSNGLSAFVGVGGIGITTGSNGQVFISGSSGGGGGGGSSVTFAGDLTGNSSTQQVVFLTGATGSLGIASGTPLLKWDRAASAPTLSQDNVTTTSAIGQALTIRAQNATGTTSTGGAAVVTSGTGTSVAGSVRLQTGGTDRVVISPTIITVNPVHTDITGNSKTTIRTHIANVQTTNATVTTLYSWTIANNAATTVDVTVVGVTSSGGSINAMVTAKRSQDFRRNNGSTVTAVGSVVDNGFKADAALAGVVVTIDNSTTTGRVRVTGLASTTIQWTANIQIHEAIQ